MKSLKLQNVKQNMKLEINMHINPTLWEMRAARLKVIYVICFRLKRHRASWTLKET